MIDVAEDIQGSTLRKQYFSRIEETRITKINNKKSWMQQCWIIEDRQTPKPRSGIFTLFSKSYLLAIPEISLEFRFLVFPKTAFARWILGLRDGAAAAQSNNKINVPKSTYRYQEFPGIRDEKNRWREKKTQSKNKINAPKSTYRYYCRNSWNTGWKEEVAWKKTNSSLREQETVGEVTRFAGWRPAWCW